MGFLLSFPFFYTIGTYRKGKSQALSALHLCRDLAAKAMHPMAFADADFGNGNLNSLTQGAASVGALSASAVAEAQERAARAAVQAGEVYGRASIVLRDKREQGLLQQAQHELGNLQHTFPQTVATTGSRSGDRPAFEKSWRGSVDALFSMVDADSHWESTYADLVKGSSKSSSSVMGLGATTVANGDVVESPALAAALVNKFGALPCWLCATVLGKLGRYSTGNHRKQRLSLALMALPLWRAPFALSLAHPSRLCDYATYVPSLGSLFAGVDLFADPKRLSVVDVLASLEQCARTLLTQKEGLLAFPVLALLECVAGQAARSPRRVLKARLLRVEALSQAGMAGAACSMLASVLQGSGVGGSDVSNHGQKAPPPSSSSSSSSPSPSVSAVRVPFGPPPAPDPDPHGGNGAAYMPPYPWPKPPPTSGTPAPPTAASLLANMQGPYSIYASASAAAPNPNAAAAVEDSADAPPAAKNSDPHTRPGLPFYGLSPFYEHLPLHHPANQPALEWLVADVDKEAAAAAEAAVAAAAASGGKGGKPGKPGKPDPAAEAAAAAAEAAAAAAALLGPAPSPRGAEGLAPWVAPVLGAAGKRALALCRGKLLMSLAPAHSGIGGGGLGKKATTLARVRSAAAAMGCGVAEQCVQRGLVAFPTGLKDPAGAAQSAADAAIALAGGSGSAANSRPPSAGSGSASSGGANEKSSSSSAMEALAGVRLSGELLRSLVDGQLLRADVALAECHPQEARLVAAAAAVCVAAQARLAEVDQAAAAAAAAAEVEAAKKSSSNGGFNDVNIAERATVSFATTAIRESPPSQETVGAEATSELGEVNSYDGGGRLTPAVPGAKPDWTELTPPEFTGPGADAALTAWESTMATSKTLAQEQADDQDWAQDEDSAEDSGLLAPEKWLRLRELLASVALQQGRYNVVSSQVLSFPRELFCLFICLDFSC